MLRCACQLDTPGSISCTPQRHTWTQTLAGNDRFPDGHHLVAAAQIAGVVPSRILTFL